MKINLPDSQDEITLEMYDKFVSLDVEADNYEDLIFSLFTGIDAEDILSVSKKDIDAVLIHVYNAIQIKGKFKNKIVIDCVELGFIPNLDNITAGEYTDLVNYSSKEVDGYNKYLNKLIAVLYRPVKGNDKFGNYKLGKYEGTSGHLDLINKLPMSLVNGCLGFFLTLSDDLENHIQVSTVEEQVKELSH
jgi:hypothetical protein